VKKVRRSSTDRVLLGVCGGLGEYFDVDGDLVRLAWIFLSLLGGVGILPYVAAILLFPEPGVPTAEPARPRMARNVGLALAAIGGWLVVRQFGLEPLGAGALVWPWRTLIPFILVAVGVTLVWPGLRELVTPGGRVKRSVSNRVLAGVCGGLGEESGIDANLLRLGFVTAAVMSTGLAALAYVLLIFVLPEEEVTAEPPVASSGPPVPPVPPAPPAAEPPAPPEAVEPAEAPGQGPPENGR
jgi:phage shock protein C